MPAADAVDVFVPPNSAVEADPPQTAESPTSSDSGLLVELADSHLETHKDKVPKAEVNPDHIAQLPTTVEAPALGEGDTERPTEADLEDLGWSSDPTIPVPVLHGMTNEELWILVRRFNKSIYHVRSIPPPPGKLDLNIASDEEFFPDKLRSTVERLYITVFLSLVAGVKHIARIRTWKERNRTAGFCAAYLLAWIFNLIMPLFFGTIIVLIVHPPSRRTLFPPAPLAKHSAISGEKQKPQAGYLGSADSMTGAAEAYKGQAAEQEASNFVTGFTAIAVGSATGQGAPAASPTTVDGAQPHTDSSHPVPDSTSTPTGDMGASLPDPTSVVGGAANAQATAFGDSAELDKTKKPVENAMWSAAGPIMHGVNTVSDTWERFRNAFSPTPPYAQNTARLRIAAVFLPLFFLSLVINQKVLYKSTTFGVGLGMFGQPLFDRLNTHRLIQFLNKHYPNWRDMLDIRNTLLLGVPTNAQLTITLLRIGEANKAPLPPPPPPGGIKPPEDPELEEAPASEHEQELHDDSPSSKSKKPSKLVGFIKGTTKAGVRSVLGVDHIKAAVSEPSKMRRGVVGTKREERENDGPTAFAARHHGKKGSVVISALATVPCISFVKDLESNLRDTKPIFTVAVDEIAHIRKVGGFGWKGKMIVGWALGAEVADGLEITDKQGRVEHLTAIPRRDEVFNRLIALSHKTYWESC